MRQAHTVVVSEGQKNTEIALFGSQMAKLQQYVAVGAYSCCSNQCSYVGLKDLVRHQTLVDSKNTS
jgi:hypothetical protein